MNLTDLPAPDVWDLYDGSPVAKETFHAFSLTTMMLAGCIALFGVVFNIINVIVFYRQGPLSSSSTTILTGLAISDFLACFLSVIDTVLVSVEILVDVSAWTWEIGYFSPIVMSRPMIYVSQITCLLTAFVTIERAVSVTFPFKVKAIFTPIRSLVAVVLIFVVTFVVHLPNFLEYEAAWSTRPYTNISYLTFVLSDALPPATQTVFFYTSPVFLRFASMFVVVLCNVNIFWKVKLSQKFRKSNANTSLSGSQPDAQSKEMTSQEPANSNKDMKLLRMIVVVSLVFCVCYSLSIVQTIVFFLVYDFDVDYHWVAEHMTFQTSLVFQVFNSTINFVIYYKMSSRYKEELNMCCGQIKKSLARF